jgi:hypothetical protein
VTIGELRQPRIDRVVETEPTLLHQDHGGGRSDGLGERGDAKDGVAPHRRGLPERDRAHRLHVHVVVATDECHEPGQLPALDVSRQHPMHSFEP